MKELFDEISWRCSKEVTKTYSTSFSMAVMMLAPEIRQHIYNIYGFVRFTDEIVDSFHDYDKEKLLARFEKDLENALNEGISLNPILNSFQHTVKKYTIPLKLIDAFMESMRKDLYIEKYETDIDLKHYIYGSADVVGLMCLRVFVNGNDDKFEALKVSAMRLGSAFQKVNFLRDLKHDSELLNRTYFPDLNVRYFDNSCKERIVNEIEQDFGVAYKGLVQLPKEAKFGVYTAYIYYKRLLWQLKQTPSAEIIQSRIRVSNPVKLGLLAKSFVSYKLNLL